MEDDAFLSRLYDLTQMGSTDYRFRTADRDIQQHRVLNRSDWDNAWIFSDGRFDLLHCSDEKLLRFLCETIHPIVQPDEVQVAALVDIYNSELANDGFQIAEVTRISGRPIFAGRETVAQFPSLEAAKQLGESLTADHLNQQITRMQTSIHNDPALAIGTAKELIETCCKTILREREERVDDRWDVPKLVHEVLRVLNLTPNQVPGQLAMAEPIRKTLGNLAQVAQGVAELRNLYGTGHGKDGSTLPPPAHHARLAVGAASTLVVFLFETHNAGRGKPVRRGDVSPAAPSRGSSPLPPQ